MGVLGLASGLGIPRPPAERPSRQGQAVARRRAGKRTAKTGGRSVQRKRHCVLQGRWLVCVPLACFRLALLARSVKGSLRQLYTLNELPKWQRVLSWTQILGGVLGCAGAITEFSAGWSGVFGRIHFVPAGLGLLSISGGLLLRARSPYGLWLSLLTQTAQLIVIGAPLRYVYVAGPKALIVLSQVGVLLSIGATATLQVAFPSPDGSLNGTGLDTGNLFWSASATSLRRSVDSRDQPHSCLFRHDADTTLSDHLARFPLMRVAGRSSLRRYPAKGGMSSRLVMTRRRCSRVRMA